MNNALHILQRQCISYARSVYLCILSVCFFYRLCVSGMTMSTMYVALLLQLSEASDFSSFFVVK